MIVSVCLCTYNGEKYLSELLDSLLSQTKIPDELIIVDDCSTDCTQKIINAYIKKFNQTKVKFFINDTNLGWKINFHKALSLATGDYIFTCDQDDIWVDQKIEKMINISVENSIQLLACNYIAKYSENALTVKEFKNSNKLKKVTSTREFLNPSRPGCCYCISKVLVSEFLSNWDKSFAHDAQLWKIAFLRNSLYIFNYGGIYFRRHSNNASDLKVKKISKERKDYNLNSINMYMKSIDNLQKCNKNKILMKAKKWINLRKKLYLNKSVFSFIKLFFLNNFYRSFKAYLLDIIAIIF